MRRGRFPPIFGGSEMKIRFKKTDFGWQAWVDRGIGYVYFGHFRTQREARNAWWFQRQWDSGLRY